MLYNMYAFLTDYNFDIWKDGSFAVRDEKYKLLHTFDDEVYGSWSSPSDFLEGDDTLDGEDRCAQQFVRGPFKVC